jgi:hypothetical protein
VLVDKKARAFAKMIKTWQIRQPALPRAFPSEKHEIARAFYVKNDQNYVLWHRNCRPATTTYRILEPRYKLTANIEGFGQLMPAS